MSASGRKQAHCEWQLGWEAGEYLTLRPGSFTREEGIAVRAKVVIRGLRGFEGKGPPRVVRTRRMEVPELLPDAVHDSATIFFHYPLAIPNKRRVLAPS